MQPEDPASYNWVGSWDFYQEIDKGYDDRFGGTLVEQYLYHWIFLPNQTLVQWKTEINYYVVDLFTGQPSLLDSQVGTPFLALWSTDLNPYRQLGYYNLMVATSLISNTGLNIDFETGQGSYDISAPDIKWETGYYYEFNDMNRVTAMFDPEDPYESPGVFSRKGSPESWNSEFYESESHFGFDFNQDGFIGNSTVNPDDPVDNSEKKLIDITVGYLESLRAADLNGDGIVAEGAEPNLDTYINGDSFRVVGTLVNANSLTQAKLALNQMISDKGLDFSGNYFYQTVKGLAAELNVLTDDLPFVTNVEVTDGDLSLGLNSLPSLSILKSLKSLHQGEGNFTYYGLSATTVELAETRNSSFDWVINSKLQSGKRYVELTDYSLNSNTISTLLNGLDSSSYVFNISGIKVGASDFVGSASNFGGNSLSYRSDTFPNNSTAYTSPPVKAEVEAYTNYIVGFSNTISANPLSIDDFNTLETDVADEVVFTIHFYNGEQLSHISLSGAELSQDSGYSYMQTAGIATENDFSDDIWTLKLKMSSGQPAISNSVSSNNGVEVMGMILHTIDSNQAGTDVDFGGSVFRTNAWWNDINGLDPNYKFSDKCPGINISGTNENPIDFDFYFNKNYLERTYSTDFDSIAGGFASTGLSAVNDENFNTGTYIDVSKSESTSALRLPVAITNVSSTTGGSDHELFQISFSNDSWSEANLSLVYGPTISTDSESDDDTTDGTDDDTNDGTDDDTNDGTDDDTNGDTDDDTNDGTDDGTDDGTNGGTDDDTNDGTDDDGVNDDTPPTIEAAVIDGDRLTIILNEDIKSTVPKTNNFKVMNVRKKIKVESVSVDTDTDTVVLSMKDAVDANDQDITLDYKTKEKDQTRDVIEDLAGNDLQSIKGVKVENNTFVDPNLDLTSPTVTAASIVGDTLTINFNEDIESTVPKANNFKVNIGRKKSKVESIEMFDATKLLAADLIDAQGAATTDPNHNSITSEAEFRNLISVYASSTGQSATFTLVSPFDSSITNGVQATVGAETFEWNVGVHGAVPDAGTGPHATRDGVGLSFTEAELAAMRTTSNTLSLTLKDAAEVGVDVTFDYKTKNKDQDAGVVEDLAGNDLQSFKNQPVSNDTFADPNVDSSSPEVESAYIVGDTLTINFDEDIDSTVPKANNFKVKIGRKKTKVESVTVDQASDSVVLALKNAAEANDEVTFDYKTKNKDQDTGVIQDLAGNDLQSFKDELVTNLTAADAITGLSAKAAFPSTIAESNGEVVVDGDVLLEVKSSVCIAANSDNDCSSFFSSTFNVDGLESIAPFHDTLT